MTDTDVSPARDLPPAGHRPDRRVPHFVGGEDPGLPVEGTWRAHQVPLVKTRTNPEHCAQLEQWMRSCRPEELLDATGRLMLELQSLTPLGDWQMSANPHAKWLKTTRSIPRRAPIASLNYLLPALTYVSTDEACTREHGEDDPAISGWTFPLAFERG